MLNDIKVKKDTGIHSHLQTTVLSFSVFLFLGPQLWASDPRLVLIWIRNTGGKTRDDQRKK
jgi:hypothetical protein